jgi:hypothetical protein
VKALTKKLAVAITSISVGNLQSQFYQKGWVVGECVCDNQGMENFGELCAFSLKVLALFSFRLYYIATLSKTEGCILLVLLLKI